MGVPGRIPSPMGEVVDYAPSWVAIWITLGVLSLAIFVVAPRAKPALIIEQGESYVPSRYAYG